MYQQGITLAVSVAYKAELLCARIRSTVLPTVIGVKTPSASGLLNFPQELLDQPRSHITGNLVPDKITDTEHTENLHGIQTYTFCITLALKPELSLSVQLLEELLEKLKTTVSTKNQEAKILLNLKSKQILIVWVLWTYICMMDNLSNLSILAGTQSYPQKK